MNLRNLTYILHTEWLKVRNYRTFWLLAGLYTLTLLLLLFSLQGILNNVTVNINSKSPLPIPEYPVYSFPGVWQNLTYIAGFLKMFPAFLIIILITNEFTFSTYKQQIISGSRRMEFLTAKTLLVVILSAGIALLIGISGMITGLLQPSPDYGAIVSQKTVFLASHALELFTYLMFASFLAFLFRRAGITIIVFLLYSLIIERILVFRLPDAIGRFLPLEACGNLVPLPNSALMKIFGVSFSEYTAVADAGICFGWAVVFYLMIYWLLRKRDL